MTELRRLVERYAVSGELDFQAFRRAFVMDFLTGCEDPATWMQVLQIESDCDDFEQGELPEPQLKLNLLAKCRAASGVLYQPVQVTTPSEASYTQGFVSGSSTTLQPEVVGLARQLAGVTLAWEFA